MNNQQDKKKNLLSSLNNGLKVMDVLSVQDNIGVTEISRICRISKTSAYNILCTLESRDYVTKTADAKYRLGPKLAAMSDIISERRSLSDVAAPYLKRLKDMFHETVAVNVLNANGRIMIMERAEGDSPDRVVDRVGFEIDANTIAAGKVLLAYLDKPVQKSMVENLRYRIYTPFTITNPDVLYTVIEDVRKQGYAADCNERYMGLGTIAVPIFDSSSQCIASLSVVCTEETYKNNFEYFTNELMNTGRQISLQMGYYELPHRKEAD